MRIEYIGEGRYRGTIPYHNGETRVNGRDRLSVLKSIIDISYKENKEREDEFWKQDFIQEEENAKYKYDT